MDATELIEKAEKIVGGPAELARLIGWDTSALVGARNGRRPLPPTQAAKIAEIAGLDPKEAYLSFLRKKADSEYEIKLLGELLRLCKKGTTVLSIALALILADSSSNKVEATGTYAEKAGIYIMTVLRTWLVWNILTALISCRRRSTIRGEIPVRLLTTWICAATCALAATTAVADSSDCRSTKRRKAHSPEDLTKIVEDTFSQAPCRLFKETTRLAGVKEDQPPQPKLIETKVTPKSHEDCIKLSLGREDDYYRDCRAGIRKIWAIP